MDFGAGTVRVNRTVWKGDVYPPKTPHSRRTIGGVSYPEEGSTDLELPQGYDEMTISNGIPDKGTAMVVGHPAEWNLGYSASTMPWTSVNTNVSSDYPNYLIFLRLDVCVDDLHLSTSMDVFGALSDSPDEAPQDESTAERNASVPEARNEVHEEINRRYEAHIGAMTDTLESVDAEGLFNDGGTDLDAIPTSLDGVDSEISNPFGGPLEGFANAPEGTEDYGTTESTSSASPDSSASPSSENILEEFAREYDEASRDEDWAKTYSMLDESSL